MKSVWHALIWKEWHEHKWKLVALTAVLIALPAMTLLSEEPNGIFTAVTATMWLAVPMLSVFIGASAAAGENSERTMPFLQSMPTPMSYAALVKLVSAILTVCISVACVIAFTYVVAIVGSQLDASFYRGIDDDRIFVFLSENDWYLSRLFLGWGSGISFVIWIAAVGVNRSDEVRSGALGILAIVSYWFLLFIVAWSLDLPSPISGFPMEFKTLAAIGPGSPVVAMWLENPEALIRVTPPLQWPIALASIAFHALLAICFVARFGRVPHGFHPSEPTAAVIAGQWLAPPRRTRFGVLVWKQFRESGPLALIAMCATFAMWLILTVFVVYKTFREGATWDQVSMHLGGITEFGFQITTAVWMSVGFFVAIVAGIGVFFEELRPGMDMFWRSRPIDRDLWFWTKFSFGMSITLLALLVPVLMALWIAAGQDVDVFGPDQNFAGGILVFLIQAAVFAVAAAAMILVRQAIYAAVLAIGVAAGVMFLIIEFEWEEPGATASFAVSTVLATLLAWVAVRNDWSLRG